MVNQDKEKNYGSNRIDNFTIISIIRTFRSRHKYNIKRYREINSSRYPGSWSCWYIQYQNPSEIKTKCCTNPVTSMSMTAI